MSDGRFGPIEPDGKPPRRRYRLNYDRLITLIMIVIIVVIAVLLIADWQKNKRLAANNNIITIATPAPDTRVQNAPAASDPALSLRPTAQPNFVPIFRQANTNDLRIAITVDDCSDASNIYAILSLCQTYNAQLTFFPTGEEVLMNEDLWRAVYLGGHEIENHTYSNDPSFASSLEIMDAEIDMGAEAIRNAINADYQPHFLRPGDTLILDDPQLNALLLQKGYYGLAMWTVDTPRSLDEISAGQVLLYHATDDGVQRLRAAMPILAASGFEMITMNELFAYPANIEVEAEKAG